MASAREAAALKSAEFHCSAFDVPAVSTDQLIEMLRRVDDTARPVLVDVRTAAERQVARVPGALSRSEFEAKIADFGDSDVVVMCIMAASTLSLERPRGMRPVGTVGRRSGQYAADVQKRGVCKRVWNSHGICAYSHHNDAFGDGPQALVDDAGAPATRVHVYARPWDFASDRFEAVKFGPIGAVAAMWRRD